MVTCSTLWQVNDGKILAFKYCKRLTVIYANFFKINDGYDSKIDNYNKSTLVIEGPYFMANDDNWNMVNFSEVL